MTNELIQIGQNFWNFSEEQLFCLEGAKTQRNAFYFCILSALHGKKLQNFMQTHGLNKLKIGLYLSLVILAMIFGIIDRCSSRPQKEKTRLRKPVIGYLNVIRPFEVVRR